MAHCSILPLAGTLRAQVNLTRFPSCLHLNANRPFSGLGHFKTPWMWMRHNTPRLLRRIKSPVEEKPCGNTNSNSPRQGAAQSLTSEALNSPDGEIRAVDLKQHKTGATPYVTTAHRSARRFSLVEFPLLTPRRRVSHLLQNRLCVPVEKMAPPPSTQQSQGPGLPTTP